MKIIIAALGQDVEQYETVKADKADFQDWQWKYNLDHLWAWNINGYPGYEADGPAIFLEF